MYQKQDDKQKTLQNLKLKSEFISSEQIRMIRTNVEYLEMNGPICLLVTSPDNQVQKPIITAKLAISFAEQGKKVLLVDANIRNPSIHKLFQLKNTEGLINVMSKEVYSQVPAQDTFITGLSVLTTGVVSVNKSPIWISGKVKELIMNLKTQYDLAIFEGPEFLSVSDSQILAANCDGFVLVIRENQTKRVDVLHTKSTLERANKEIIGVIYQTG